MKLLFLSALVAASCHCAAIADPSNADKQVGHQTTSRTLFLPGDGACVDASPIEKDKATTFSDNNELRKLWLLGMASSCSIKTDTNTWPAATLQSVLSESFDWLSSLYDWSFGGAEIAMLVPELEPNYPVSDSNPRFFQSESSKKPEPARIHEPIVQRFVNAYLAFKKDFIARLRPDSKSTSVAFESSREELMQIVGQRAIEQLESDLRAAFGKKSPIR